MVNHTFCVTSLFLSKIGFSHNFGFRYTTKSIKDAKDSDFGLVSKKHEPKNRSLDWRPGPDKVGHKFENIPTCDVPHSQRNPNLKNFFST